MNNTVCTAPPCVNGLALMVSCGDALLDVCLATERRVGTDDDLQIMQDVTVQVTRVCADLADRAHTYETRSWRFRLIMLGAALFWRSRWADDMRALDELADLCQRIPASMSAEYRAAARYAQRGRLDWVAHERGTVLKGLWFHAGRCLSWGDPR